MDLLSVCIHHTSKSLWCSCQYLSHTPPVDACRHAPPRAARPVSRFSSCLNAVVMERTTDRAATGRRPAECPSLPRTTTMRQASLVLWPKFRHILGYRCFSMKVRQLYSNTRVHYKMCASVNLSRERGMVLGTGSYGHTSEVNKFIEQKLLPYIVSHELKIQGSARHWPGLVNFVPAVAYHFCLN